MASQPHLQIFQTGYDAGSSFTVFPLLPKELRLKIWKHSLKLRRIIRLRLQPWSDYPPAEARQGAVSREFAIPNPKSYHIFVHGHQVLSRLFHVSAESRSAALLFYRVHIPCEIISAGDSSLGPTTLYFNPEYDFLYILPTRPVQALIDFLYDLKAVYDPRRIGLLNRAMQLQNLGRGLQALQPSDLDPEKRTSFIETLSQLHEFFFISSPNGGRQVEWPQSGLSENDVFNRSLPISAPSSAFERLPRDPRNIEADLTRVFVIGSDPRLMVTRWYRLLAKWDIHAPNIKYKLSLSFRPPKESTIYDFEDAHEFLRKEDEEWTATKNMYREWRIERFKDDPAGAGGVCEDLEIVARPAVGFWLFPLEALGPMRKEGEEVRPGFRYKPKRILDLREHWPELCLLDLY